MYQIKRLSWITRRSFIIFYMVLAFYIFSDVFGGLGLLAWWVGTILPFTSIHISYSLLMLAMIISAILTTLPLMPLTQEIQKEHLWICTVIAYALICCIYTIVFTGNYWERLIYERSDSLLYLLGQLSLLFLLRKTWQKIERKIKQVILFSDAVFLIGFVILCGGGNTFNEEHVAVFILIKFLKIITGL